MSRGKNNIIKKRVAYGLPDKLSGPVVDEAAHMIFRKEYMAKEFFVNYYKNKLSVNTTDDGERVLIESCLYPNWHRHIDDYCVHCSKALEPFQSILNSDDGMTIGFLYSLQFKTPAMEMDVANAAKRLGVKL